MPDAVSSISSFLTSAAPAINAGTAGAGAIGNIINAITRGKATSALEAEEGASPTALAGKVAAATQPLNAGLVQSVQNATQADLASRGLSQAPGVWGAEESQALAPFEQQNQNTALQLILQQMGVPISILQNTNGNSSIMNQIMALMLKNANPTPTSTGVTSSSGPGPSADQPSVQQLLPGNSNVNGLPLPPVSLDPSTLASLSSLFGGGTSS